MEAIIFTGIQASGKSTFYKQLFADTHVRINLDMLKTRHREKMMFQCCLNISQPFVIDNTNLTRQDRQRYLPEILAANIPVHGYYFDTRLENALLRNRLRGDRAIPEKGVRAAFSRMEPPCLSEGYTTLSKVVIPNHSLDNPIFDIV